MAVPGSWAQRILFIVGILFLASYFGLMSFGLEEALDSLAKRQESTATLFSKPGGQGEALYVVFVFIFLTPVAAAFVLIVPLFGSAVFAEVMRNTLRVPEAISTLLFLVVIAVVLWVSRAAWAPSAEWFMGVLARALLVGLGYAS